ncbi:MAG: NAD-dependent epimerase/dehydratase family protein [Chloroflexi bacterium]|nr:NAD-dependent epimerase/dehydratase family protein [Chloroflexota bacterium]
MRILVTGGAGFIGSHCVDALLAREHQVRILDLLTAPVHLPGHWPEYLDPRAERIRGDVTDRAVLRSALDGIDAVLHLAAYQDHLTDFSHFFQVNAAGTALLYELIVAEHLPVGRIVVASSQAVAGEGLHRCERHGALVPEQRTEQQLRAGAWDLRCPDCSAVLTPLPTPEAVFSPHNSYAMAKRDQEEIALKLGRRYGIPSVALRFSIVQGPRQSFRNAYSGALRIFTVQALAGRAPLLYEDGQQLRDFISVHDTVDAVMLAVEDSRSDGLALNVGGDRQVSVHELAVLVMQEAGLPGAPEAPGLFRFGDTRHALSSVSRLRSFGWRSQRNQQEIVAGYVSWARQQPDLTDTTRAAEEAMRRMGVLRPTSR